jgi:predicted transcriptional regulator
MKQAMTKAEKQAAYDAWYLAEVQKGLDDIEAGRVISHEEAEREMGTHMEKLKAVVPNQSVEYESNSNG